MIIPREYPTLAWRIKSIQRDTVVRVLFGGQTRLAAIMGMSQPMVNHVIWGRRRSRRIEEFVAAQARRLRPDLLDLWQDSPSHHRVA